jgi:hypothetical protein
VTGKVFDDLASSSSLISTLFNNNSKGGFIASRSFLESTASPDIQALIFDFKASCSSLDGSVFLLIQRASWFRAGSFAVEEWKVGE